MFWKVEAMEKNRLFRILFWCVAIILLGVGLYLWFFTDMNRNLYTAMFLRAGFISLMFAVFWKKFLELPRWTDIGWLPIVAALIAWKPFLLKFAVPTSVLLVFLMSPLARGKYKPKSWRGVISTVQTVRNARSSVKTAVAKKVVNAVAEAVKENVKDTVTKNIKETNSEKESSISQKSKSSKNDIRGPQAKNAMFRAMSRVAGRQVGKMMNSGKKGK